jgi:hypothetical protein
VKTSRSEKYASNKDKVLSGRYCDKIKYVAAVGEMGNSCRVLLGNYFNELLLRTDEMRK